MLNIEQISNRYNKFAVSVSTQKQFEEVLLHGQEIGFAWSDGSPPTSLLYLWDYHQNATVLYFDSDKRSIMYGRLPISNSYREVKFDDVVGVDSLEVHIGDLI